MKSSYFYHKKPVIGLDIGTQTIKFMQLKVIKKTATVKAYGSIPTPEKIVKDGAIIDVEHAAHQVGKLLTEKHVGTLNTNRVAMSIPTAHVFSRVLNLPIMPKKELSDAIKLEVEQSIPVPIAKLYYDYEVTDLGDPKNVLVRMVAAPRQIVDSYQSVCDLLGLDLVLVQTNIRADAQLCKFYESITDKSPYIIVDIGGNSIDIGLLDATLRVTGTVEEGGNGFTRMISEELNVSHSQAHDLKVNKGITAGSQRDAIMKAVSPILERVEQEIKKLIRFYAERISSDTAITQILIVGGGANMPGLGDYLTDKTHIPARVSSPWDKFIKFDELDYPDYSDLPHYLTCAGLALATEKDIVN